jgi:hypothetical protein
MTAVHPTAFKQQVAKKKKKKTEKETFAKQKSTRYATLAGGLMLLSTLGACWRILPLFTGCTVLSVDKDSACDDKRSLTAAGAAGPGVDATWS